MKTLTIALAALVTCGFSVAPAAAQPILERVEKLLRDQVDSGKPAAAPAEPGYLGLIANDTPDASGVRVLQVLAGQPASAATIRVGDVIAQIDGRPIRTLEDMAQAVAGKPAGTKLSISVLRGGQPQQLALTLGRRPGAPAVNEELPIPSQPAAIGQARPRLGIRSVPVSESVRRQNNLPALSGAQVISVTVGSPAERAAIPLGAVVTAVNDKAVASPQELSTVIAAADDPQIELSYVYRGQPVRTKVTLDGAAAAAAVPPPEVRAKPPIPEQPGPAPPRPGDNPFADDPARQPPAQPQLTDRFTELERRLAELEARIKTLETALEKATAAETPRN